MNLCAAIRVMKVIMLTVIKYVCIFLCFQYIFVCYLYAK